MRAIGLSCVVALALAGSALALGPGDRVLVNWELKGFDFVGKVTKIEGDSISIVYDDESTEVAKAANVHAFDWKPGDTISCLWKGDNKWYTATILSLADPKIHVKYEDGSEEDTMLLQCRRPLAAAAPASPAAPPAAATPAAPAAAPVAPAATPAAPAATPAAPDATPAAAAATPSAPAAPPAPTPAAPAAAPATPASTGSSGAAAASPAPTTPEACFAAMEASIRSESKDAFTALVHPAGLGENLVGGSGIPAAGVYKQGTGKKWFLKPDFSKAEKKGDAAMLVPCAIWSWEQNAAKDAVVALVVLQDGKWLFLGAGEKAAEVAALADRWVAKQPLAPPPKGEPGH